MHQKPELLAPAGNAESFNAALGAGADAVYLGLQELNARGRAGNFSRPMLQLAVAKAHAKNVKVYITLNVLIKNREIDQLIDTLSFLDSLKVDAVIVQDWGVFFIARKYFPRLTLHASTQMGIHNSVGVDYGSVLGLARSVLARELTMPELETIARNCKGELEVFVHGALCYSFSGMCLFSSYMGGQGANRGFCKQSCRRFYSDADVKSTPFSLKDNQQIQNIRKLIDLKVCSLKIEGRMKSSDYVHQVCKAYRMVLDDPRNISLATQMLELDMGREKTSWFMGGSVVDGITDDISVGICIGHIIEIGKGYVKFDSSEILENGSRIRVRNADDDGQLYVKIENVRSEGAVYQVPFDFTSRVQVGDQVLLVKTKSQGFSSRLGKAVSMPVLPKPQVSKHAIKQGLIIGNNILQKTELLVRIESPEWLPKLRFSDYDAVILSYKRADWREFDMQSAVYQENKIKIRIEFPKFIPEKLLGFYRNLADRLFVAGYNHFFISHLSQKMLLPRGAKFTCNENVYVLNDAAARMLHDERAEGFSYPVENDIDNLLSMANKQGIVPLYYYPSLFYSRMPVKIKRDSQFSDESGKKFKISVSDGVTIVRPLLPVALFYSRKRLENSGFRRFLIDFSGEPMTANVVKRILKKYLGSEPVHPSSNFNFKLGLK